MGEGKLELGDGKEVLFGLRIRLGGLLNKELFDTESLMILKEIRISMRLAGRVLARMENELHDQVSASLIGEIKGEMFLDYGPTYLDKKKSVSPYHILDFIAPEIFAEENIVLMWASFR